MKVEINWKEPPPRPSRIETQNAAILAELKRNPGRWALMLTDRSSSGAGGGWKKLGCEVRACRKNPGEAKAKYDIYVRWPVTAEGVRAARATADAAVPKPAPAYAAGGLAVRPAGPGPYNPADRERRGVPAEGLHPAVLRR